MDQNFSSFQNYQPGEDQEIPFVQIKNAGYFRARAKNALKGKFANAFLVTFLHYLIIVAIAFVSAIVMVAGLIPTMLANPESELVINSTYLISMGLGYGVMILGMVFLGAPLMVGYYRSNLEIVDGKEIGAENLFYYFKKDYFKTVKLYVLYSLILFVGSIPSLAFELLYSIGVLPNGWVSDLLGSVCYIVSLVLNVYLSLRYSMAFFILAEYPEMRTVDILRSSTTMMRGRKKKLFCLYLSFIGWILLALLVGACSCGLALLVVPFPLMTYIMASAAAFYDDAANREAAREAEFPSLDPDDYSFDAGEQENIEKEETDES